MRKKERLTLNTNEILVPGNLDEQMINDLIQQRKLQQDALMKIMTYMDKSGQDEKSAHPEVPRHDEVKSQNKVISANKKIN